MVNGEERAIRRAAEALAGARRMLVFTGAGVSVESGIPPFRGPGGLYERFDERHLDIRYFLSHLEESWRTIREIFYSQAIGKRPNGAHEAIARWEGEGRVHAVVTQNIDALHSRAGSRGVVEFHGTLATLSCLRCGAKAAADDVDFGELPPRCACGGYLRPDFVFFGEGIPRDAYAAAFRAASDCDACLIVGSTGIVYPAAEVPRAAAGRGVPVVEVNPEPSEFSRGLPSTLVRLPAAAALEGIDEELRRIDPA
jgi:NAD-dependent deacetylase